MWSWGVCVDFILEFFSWLCVGTMTTRASSSRMEKATRKSKKSSKRVQRMDDVRFEDDDVASEYERLMGLSHHTRWVDCESIKKMCMDEALVRCYSNIGLNVMLRWNNIHYPALTSERWSFCGQREGGLSLEIRGGKERDEERSLNKWDSKSPRPSHDQSFGMCHLS